MTPFINEYGQPVGPDIDGWQPPLAPALPARQTLLSAAT